MVLSTYDKGHFLRGIDQKSLVPPAWLDHSREQTKTLKQSFDFINPRFSSLWILILNISFLLFLQQRRKTQMIAASKRCGPPQTFSHTLKSKYFAVSKWREAQTYEVSQPTFDSINSPASLLCQFTYCFVCKICMIFCQPDLRYKQNKLAKNLLNNIFACRM